MSRTLRRAPRLGPRALALLLPALAACQTLAPPAPGPAPQRPAPQSEPAPTGKRQLEGRVVARLASPPSEGRVQVQLYGSAGAFGDLRDPLRVVSAPAATARELVIDGLPPGVFALVVHHDADSDGVIDRNFLGIPVEPIAFSRGYRPKGPPIFERARFELAAGEERVFDLELERTRGKRGRLGVGLGVIGRSNPYRGADGGVFQPIPAVTYIGDRVQILGPNARLGLLGQGERRLALTARYRIGPYEEDDADILEGLGDSEDTLLLGLALVQELPAGLEAELAYEHDALDRIGGGVASLSVERSFQAGIARLTPRVGLIWLDDDLSTHDFGVPAAAAIPGRPAYDLSGTLNYELGLGAFVELGRSWRIVLDVGVELLDSEIRDSPLVEKDFVLQGFLSLGYSF